MASSGLATRIVTYSFFGAMAVLVIMNAPGAVSVGKTLFQGWQGETTILTGSGYKRGK